MGVDEIDKADIFDEYFDNDKPKITNFEKIKSCKSIDEMAEFIHIKICHDYCEYDCIVCVGCIQDFKQWLQEESEEQ